MNGNDPIVEFAGVTIAATPGHAGVRRVSARFLPGTLTLIRTEEGVGQPPIAGMAEGLHPPEEGRVLFMGEDWAAMPPERALERRGRIGRVFDGCGWISNLSVEENVSLSLRHHTRRPEDRILEEAGALARAFGLREVPKSRPALVPHQDLRRAEWVRAFLGRPLLILLEHPMRGVPFGHLPRLIAAGAGRLRAEGGRAVGDG